MAEELIDIIAEETQEGTEATLSSWLVDIGQPVTQNDPIAELETDKVTVELAAPENGVLQEILKQPGEAINPGDILGRIGRGSKASSAAVTVENNQQSTASLSTADAKERLNREKLSPAVRKLIKQHNLNSQSIVGSGRGGRITVADIKTYLAEQQTVAAGSGSTVQTAQPTASQLNDGLSQGLISEQLPLTSMRKRIAEHMVKSVQTAPHVTAVFEIDFSAIVKHRAQHKAAFAKQGVALTYTAYIVAACAKAMQTVPTINSRLHADSLEVFSDINIGVGTALEDKGLIVPVIKQVQTLNLLGIAKVLGRLTEQARAGQLSAADVKGGTFTISNHGVSGSLLAAPVIINQGQSAILGVGKLEKRVKVISEDDEDRIVIRPMAYVTLTIDHRVLDGFQTNTYLSALKDIIEQWQ